MSALPQGLTQTIEHALNPDHVRALNLVGRLIEDLLDPGQDRAIGGVPGDPQRRCYLGQGHGLKAKGPQSPLDGCVAQPGGSYPATRTRRQCVQAKLRTRTTSSVGLQPTGTCARRRTTVPRTVP